MQIVLPSILLGLSLATLAFLVLYMLPQFIATFSVGGLALPPLTRAIFAVSRHPLMIYGLVLGFMISYWTVLTGRAGISFTLFPVSILAIQMAVSCPLSAVPVARWPRGGRSALSGVLLLLLAAIVVIALGMARHT